MPARLAALIEPLACVTKGISRAKVTGGKVAVIGAGALGLMHAFALKEFDPVVIELQSSRLAQAKNLGFQTAKPSELEDISFETIFVCPGSSSATAEAFRILAPDGTIVFFAPMPPDEPYPFSQESAYFKDAKLIHSYSCGPVDTRAAFEALQNGLFKAEEIVSDFVTLDDLPQAYEGMKSGDLFKVMVEFGG
jgi:L-iditol 2-dehydrogenase